MSPTLDEQINQLKQAIAEIETQRSILGDAAVEASLVPFHKKLADLIAQAESSVEEAPEPPTRQRKLITLLYMDVVGSTAMTQHLDPEDTLEIMDNALPRLAVPVEVHGGHVTRYTGDGFKAVFGDPLAREDDPEQAIRAGLEILQVANALAQDLQSEWGIEDFQVRIGIDTGLAALGGQTEAEDTVMGRVVNMAVRIESAAPPGGLLISHNTYRHVRGVFTVESREPITAKGFPEPVPVYLVLDIKPRAFRVRTLGVEGIETRMVGRHNELKFLQDALLTAIEEGEGQVVTITGEAGVGKSRLLYEFDNWLELLPPPNVRFFQGRGRQENQGQPYSLLRDLFAFRFQILDDDTSEGARRKIEAGFGDLFGYGGDAIMRAHIIGQLLGYNFSASPHLKGVLNDPEQLRNRGLMYLFQYFQDLSQGSPVVIFLEDIHWADDSSLDAINRLGERTPQLSLLLVCAARPTLFEWRPYWGEGQTHHTRLELRPLSKRESRQLVAEILKLAQKIPSELRELVVGGSEGNPFFMEELIKMLIEDGVIIPGDETWRVEADRLMQIEIPSTLAGVLQARLDSLPNHERRVLQQASVVGRLFWDHLVAHMQSEAGNGGDPQLVPLVLISLRGRELIYRREESAFTGAVEYLFKNDVLRDVTYESVLKRLRKTYHGLVADWLITNSGDRVGEHSGLIAEHLLLSGAIEQSCQYFFCAGESALASYANAEAEGYFRQALELTPADPLRADLLSRLGEALDRQGRSEEAIHIWRQAIELYQVLENFDRIGDVYARLSRLLWFSDCFEAWNECQEGLELLEGAPDSPGYARLLAEAGRIALFRNIADQVINLCQRAAEMAQRVGDLEDQAEASVTLALHNENIEGSISIYEKMITLTEEKGLLHTAERAHYDLGWSLCIFLIDLNSGLKHFLRSAEYCKLIGHTDLLTTTLNYIYCRYIDLGELKTAEEKVFEFLKGSSIPESRIKDSLKDNHPYLLQSRGEWISALELRRAGLNDLRQGGSLPLTVWTNLWLTDSILELNRFEDFDDLSEAEAALKENIDINYWRPISYFQLTIVHARQRSFTEARDYLVKAENDLSEYVNNLEKEMHHRAKFELALADGRWKEAVVDCEASIEIYQNCGHRWGWARRLIDLGDALLGRNQPGDLERARETYQQSLDMFTEMGAPGYIQVLEERLKNLGGVVKTI
jgi:class 3 adenylate cyclase/tetratricopeptide (TPR) repeat protein